MSVNLSSSGFLVAHHVGEGSLSDVLDAYPQRTRLSCIQTLFHPCEPPVLLGLCPEHAATLANDGFTKDQVL